MTLEVSTKLDFVHRQSAHCESGVTANLLRNDGYEITEAMVFGLGAGLQFAYLPFIRINRMPLIAFRGLPGSIMKRATKVLGVKVNRRKFKAPAEAERALDEELQKGIPTGLQVGAYFLPFFPPALRFHFNMHNLVVYGREGDEYLVSDPTFEYVVTCPVADMNKCRFAEGALAPKGSMYNFLNVPQNPDLRPVIKKAIRQVVNQMTRAPLPIVGTRGIRFFAGRVDKWPAKLGEKLAVYHLTHTIRMLEEIGTGGGGFRFVYAAFLQEAAQILENERIDALSSEMTSIGDGWREFSLNAARVCKGRSLGERPFADLSKLLVDVANREEKLYKELWKCL